MRAVLNGAEKESIATSIRTLSSRLTSFFGSNIKTQLQFGSSTRKTILPRIMDANSDIDYMVVFNDTRYKPPTYLNQLRRFSNTYYPSSSIYQSQPTLVLELQHIKFEIVPAIENSWWGSSYQIPAPSANFDDWMDTEPNSFNQKLTSTNTSFQSKIKPVIRLVKYWNSQNGFPFNSYCLEGEIVDIFNGTFFWSSQSIQSYFYYAFENLSFSYFEVQWRRESLQRAKEIISNAKRYENQGSTVLAELEIKKLIPEVQ